MKTYLFILCFFIPFYCFSQTDTIVSTEDLEEYIPFAEGKYTGLYRVKYNRTLTKVINDGIENYLPPVLDNFDTSIVISTDKKYLSINGCKQCKTEDESYYFYTAHYYVVENEEKKLGLVDSLIKPMTEMAYDEIYATDAPEFPFVLRQGKFWGFMKADGNMITPQYDPPLYGYFDEKIKSIRDFLDSDRVYMFRKEIYVKGNRVYAMVMSRDKKVVYIDPSTYQEVVADK